MSEIFRLPSEFSPDTAKNFIKVAEGLRLQAYQCTAGHWTIGYGHTRGVNAETGLLRKKPNVSWTKI